MNSKAVVLAIVIIAATVIALIYAVKRKSQ